MYLPFYIISFNPYIKPVTIPVYLLFSTAYHVLDTLLLTQNGNPLQYCLENPMDRGAWQATVHGVARVGHDSATKLLLLLLLTR